MSLSGSRTQPVQQEQTSGITSQAGIPPAPQGPSLGAQPKSMKLAFKGKGKKVGK